MVYMCGGRSAGVLESSTRWDLPLCLEKPCNTEDAERGSICTTKRRSAIKRLGCCCALFIIMASSVSSPLFTQKVTDRQKTLDELRDDLKTLEGSLESVRAQQATPHTAFHG